MDIGTVRVGEEPQAVVDESPTTDVVLVVFAEAVLDQGEARGCGVCLATPCSCPLPHVERSRRVRQDEVAWLYYAPPSSGIGGDFLRSGRTDERRRGARGGLYGLPEHPRMGTTTVPPLRC